MACVSDSKLKLSGGPLSPTQSERLMALMESLCAAHVSVGRVMSQGYQEERAVGETNQDALERALGDVTIAMEGLCCALDLRSEAIVAHVMRVIAPEAKAGFVEPQ